MIKNLIELQKHLLELLAFFDDICKKNNIKYWIDSGTLLGAVRHNNFIPWDDDIDICLLKQDYDRLLEVLSKEIKNNSALFLFYKGNDKYHFYNDYLGSDKFILQTYRNLKYPCRIDFFPMKAIEESQIQHDRALTDIANYFTFGKVKDAKYFNTDYIKKEFLDAIKTKSKFINNFNNYVDSSSLNANSYINYSFNDVSSKSYRDYYRYNDIFPLSKIKFGNLMISCPANPSSYLKKLYGDYLTPPPIHKQRPAIYKIHKNSNQDQIDLILNTYIEKQYHFFYEKNNFSYLLKTLFLDLINRGVTSTIRKKINNI